MVSERTSQTAALRLSRRSLLPGTCSGELQRARAWQLDVAERVEP